MANCKLSEAALYRHCSAHFLTRYHVVNKPLPFPPALGPRPIPSTNTCIQGESVLFQAEATRYMVNPARYTQKHRVRLKDKTLTKGYHWILAPCTPPQISPNVFQECELRTGHEMSLYYGQSPATYFTAVSNIWRSCDVVKTASLNPPPHQLPKEDLPSAVQLSLILLKLREEVRNHYKATRAH